jgi:hypothetical protein
MLYAMDGGCADIVNYRDETISATYERILYEISLMNDAKEIIETTKKKLEDETFWVNSGLTLTALAIDLLAGTLGNVLAIASPAGDVVNLAKKFHGKIINDRGKIIDAITKGEKTLDILFSEDIIITLLKQVVTEIGRFGAILQLVDDLRDDVKHFQEFDDMRRTIQEQLIFLDQSATTYSEKIRELRKKKDLLIEYANVIDAYLDEHCMITGDQSSVGIRILADSASSLTKPNEKRPDFFTSQKSQKIKAQAVGIVKQAVLSTTLKAADKPKTDNSQNNEVLDQESVAFYQVASKTPDSVGPRLLSDALVGAMNQAGNVGQVARRSVQELLDLSGTDVNQFITNKIEERFGANIEELTQNPEGFLVQSLMKKVDGIEGAVGGFESVIGLYSDYQATTKIAATLFKTISGDLSATSALYTVFETIGVTGFVKKAVNERLLNPSAIGSIFSGPMISFASTALLIHQQGKNHKEVMAALQKIQESLDRIEADIKEIKKTLDEIKQELIDLKTITRKGFEDLSEQLTVLINVVKAGFQKVSEDNLKHFDITANLIDGLAELIIDEADRERERDFKVYESEFRQKYRLAIADRRFGPVDTKIGDSDFLVFFTDYASEIAYDDVASGVATRLNMSRASKQLRWPIEMLFGLLPTMWKAIEAEYLNLSFGKFPNPLVWVQGVKAFMEFIQHHTENIAEGLSQKWLLEFVAQGERIVREFELLITNLKEGRYLSHSVIAKIVLDVIRPVEKKYRLRSEYGKRSIHPAFLI